MVSIDRLKENIEKGILEAEQKIHTKNRVKKFVPPNYDIVERDPQRFYESFGLLTHPGTQKPVEYLTDYQIDFWNSILDNKYNIAVKSNKIGLSTIALLALFQNCFFRHNAGYEKLVVGQTADMAKEHLYTLRRLILNSERFRHWLIMDHDKVLLRDEVTKARQLFIRNPYNPLKPTRIIALGSSSATSVSWKMVDFVLVSDITVAAKDYTATLDGAFTRLAMTNGRMVIETIPNGPQGRVYQIWQDAQAKKNDFTWFRLPVDLAINAGLINQKFIDSEKKRLGPFFPQYYGAEFITVGGNIYKAELIDASVKLARDLLEEPQLEKQQAFNLPKSMGVDPAFGSDSLFAIVITQKRNGIIEVIHSEEFPGMDHDQMCRMIVNMMHRYNISKVYVDSQMQSVVDKVKSMTGDPQYEGKRVAMPLRDIPFSKYKVYGVNFGRYGLEMIQHSQRIFSEGIIAIDETKHSNLLQQLRTATLINQNGRRPELDKDHYGTMDTYDAFNLSLVNYTFKDISDPYARV